MPRPSPEALGLAEAYRLEISNRLRGRGGGDHRGMGVGASLEFHDRRAYEAGDDPRHIDWRAFGRTDEPMVRVFEEEIQPEFELLLDTSKSMASDPLKAQWAVDLAWILCGASRATGLRPLLRLLPAPGSEAKSRSSGGDHRRGDSSKGVAAEELLGAGIDFESSTPLPLALTPLRGRLRRGALRILVTDGLCRTRAREWVGPVAEHAGAWHVLQVLSEFDLRPTPGSALRLVDAESGAVLERVLEEEAVEDYRRRLAALIADQRDECRRRRGGHLELDASGDLAEACRDILAPAGVLVPR